MGRPTKIEGNPQHPACLGGTDIFAQAAVLQLWDPDRSQTVMHRRDAASWDDFSAALLESTARLNADGGAGLHLLTGTVTSPTLICTIQAVRAEIPARSWHVHQPCRQRECHRGSRGLHSGRRINTAASGSRQGDSGTGCGLSVDPAAGVRYAREFIGTRSPESAQRT